MDGGNVLMFAFLFSFFRFSMPWLTKQFLGNKQLDKEIQVVLLQVWKVNILVGNMWRAPIGRPASITSLIMELVCLRSFEIFNFL